MDNLEELTWLDATAQAELVRRTEVKPVELVDAAIARIEQLNPAINAVVTPMFEEARRDAARVDPESPFPGVPYLLKDLVASYAGTRMTEGSHFLEGYVPESDSELVVRLRQAGLVIVGKTNTPEFGLAVTTEPRLFGPTRNPWNTDLTPGGSSGGSAAAVAAGMVPAAHGNDGGGSIRIPSSCCGLFGLKPTRGRNPLGREYGDVIGGIVVEHALTRSVRDSAALLDATSGPARGDPYWSPPPARPFLQEVGADPGVLRIAFSTAPIMGSPVHPDSLRAVEDAARLCADLGHEVAEASPPIDGELYTLGLGTMWTSGCAWSIDHWARKLGREPTPDKIETASWILYEMGRQQTASVYLLAVEAVQLISRDVSDFMSAHDVWLTPTLSAPPQPLGYFAPAPDDPMQGWLRSGEFSAFTTLCNLTGQPAMSVPLMWNDDGLPIGTQFAGRFGDEATLFRLAAQLEEARPWSGRRPPGVAKR
jgi:amidase